MDTGEPLSTVRDRVLSANAYIGSVPIVEALSRGANIVITGRSTDTALTMAPLRHEFGWARRRLGSPRRRNHRRPHHRVRRAVLRRQLPVRLAVRFPISRTSAIRSSRRAPTGRSSITKHPNTGGRVSVPIGDGAARLRDGRSALVHHARRRRRLHHDSARARRRRIACACSASRGGRRPTSSRCRSRIAPASRRSARSCTRGPTRSRRRSSPTACCASGSTDSDSGSTRC